MTRLALGLLGLTALLPACDLDPSGPAGTDPPGRIVDARTGGDPGFYWLPPVSALPDLASTGTFDPSLDPMLVVCRTDAEGCAGDIARFTLAEDGDGGLFLDREAEAYGAVWATDGLDAAADYRLRVVVGTAVLGTADVDVLEPGIEPDGEAGGVQVAAGSSVEVRFRIEALEPVARWDVVRVGPTGADLQAVWAATPTDAFAVGADGTILRYDGGAWALMESGAPGSLLGVGGRGPDDVWAVGTSGLVRRFDGATWTTVRSGGASLFDVWVVPGGDAFAVGAAGTILRHDATAWTAQESGTSANLQAITGTTATDLYAVGDGGVILRYDGSAWSEAVTVNGADLRDVWADPSGDVVAVGADPGGYPMIVRRRAGEWSLMPLPRGLSFALFAVWGTGPDDVYAAGARYGLLHFDGVAWRVAGLLETRGVFNGMHGAGGGFFAVGDGATVLSYDGSEVTFDPLGATLRGVWADGAGRAAAVGDAGVFVERDGASAGWTTSLLGRDLAGVWGRTAEELFVVGSSELVLHRQDGAWLGLGLPTALESARVLDFRGAATGAVLGVGERGALIYYDGQAMLSLSNPVGADLRAVWSESEGRGWAVGEQGAILRFEGGGWRAIPPPAGAPDLHDVWGASASDVFAVGRDGTILHYDGAGWQPMRSPTTERLRAVWGRSGRDAYAAGDAGTLLHYDGAAWHPLESGTTLPLHDLWGGAEGEVLAVGGAGLILRGTR